MELNLVRITMVVMLMYTSTVASQEPCGSQTCSWTQDCRSVKRCAADSGTDCSIQRECVARNLVLNKFARCPNNTPPLLRVVNIRFYTTIPCDQCKGANQQCYNAVCCSSQAEEPPEPRQDTGEEDTTFPPSCPPSCRMGCEYGMDTDNDGCPKCACKDPCRNVTCPAGQRCKVGGEKRCDGPLCRGMTTACEADTTCPLVECRSMCSMGRLRDKNGCELCACKDPCSGVICPTGQQCKVCKPTDGVCSGNGYTCETIGRADTPCSGVMCRMLCQYGHAKDSNGCDMCECAASPCLHHVCGSNERCEVESAACDTGTCYSAKCVAGPTNRQCPPVMCRVHCPYGWAQDLQTGCDMCSCAAPPTDASVTDLCKDPSTPPCPAGRTCKMTEIQCPDPPCEAVPLCVVSERQCPLTSCRMWCAGGRKTDENGCELCACNPSCQDITCGNGQQCVIQNDIPVCVESSSVSTGAPCPLSQCRMFCPGGFARDNNGCQLCQCSIPSDCTQMNCPPTSVCVLRAVTDCGQPDCGLRPVCLPLVTFTTPPTTTTTTEPPTTPAPAPRSGTCPPATLGDWAGTRCGRVYGNCPGQQLCCQSYVPVISVCKYPVDSFCDTLRPLFRNLGLSLAGLFPRCT